MLAAQWFAMLGGCVVASAPIWGLDDNVRCLKKSTIVVISIISNIMSIVLKTTELGERCWRNGLKLSGCARPA